MYYEICPKHDANGKLKQEMILVWYVKCRRKRFAAQNTNSSRRQQWNTVTYHHAQYLEAFEAHTASFDLLHANEFIRGMWVAGKVEIYLSHFQEIHSVSYARSVLDQNVRHWAQS
jgi:hypothetical protein